MDCNSSLEDIINRCQEFGINCIAISDHDSIEGALEMEKIAPFQVIVAGEILTPQGEVMGMFLKERIPIGLPIEQAIARIKAQDALVCLPHPFDPIRGLRIDGNRLQELMEQVNIIEVLNARTIFPWPTGKARTFARKYDIAVTAGSDAHTIGEIGSAYVEMPEFNGKDDFLQALRKGTIRGRRSSPLVHFHSAWARLTNLF